MEEKVIAIKATIAAIGAALTALWGWFGWLILTWIICMAIDYATGSCAALRAGKWSSKKARDGIWHKIGSVVAVLVAAILDVLIGSVVENFPGLSLPFPYSVFLCPLVVSWYILTECGSIVENAAALGAPVPSWLTKCIAGLQDSVDSSADGTDT